MIRFTYIVSFILLFSQCQAPEVKEIQGRGFFDMKNFVQRACDSLRFHTVSLEKTITLNGVSETRHIEQPDWKMELSEFSASNINRPAWWDKYNESSIKNGSSYTLKEEEELEIQQFIVTKQDSHSFITISKKISSLLHSSQKEMSYDAQEGYSIYNIRKSIGEDADTLVIRGKFSN